MSLSVDVKKALGILGFFKRELFIFFLIYFLIVVIPVKHVIIFNLIILSVLLSNKIFKGVPVFKVWFKYIIKTVIFVTIIYYVISFISGWGVFGFVVIVGVFAFWRIRTHKKFVSYIIDWSVGRLKGSNKEFDWSGKK